MKIRFQNKKGFTLIEMLIATSIFAAVILITSTIFGSSSRIQVSTKSAIANKQYAALITDKIFNNLKSCNGWGKVEAIPPAENVSRALKIKGFGSFVYRPSVSVSLAAPADTDDANLIIGFENLGSKVRANYYYFKSNSVVFDVWVASKEYDLSTIINEAEISTVLRSATAATVDANDSKIEDFKITGRNYVSAPQANLSDLDGRYQPLVTLNLTFSEIDRAGNLLKNKLQVRSAISSRNYLEEPN